MPTEIKYGVVIDNKDVNETGRVRIILLEELPAAYRTKNIIELKKLLGNLDVAGNHIPWQKSTGSKVADPYLAESFLPKHIGLIPEEGQLVKVIIYSESMHREYVGPHISSLENQKEAYTNSLAAHKTNHKKNLISQGYTNKVSDFALYGDNSQLVLGNKEAFIRTHAQEYQGKKKSTDMSLFQQSTFNTTMSVDTTKKKVVQEPEKIVSHLVEVNVEKKFREFLNEMTVIATIKVLSVLQVKNPSGKVGMTSRTYSPDKVYTDAVEELEITVKTDDINEVEMYLAELHMDLLNKKMSRLATAVPKNGGYEAVYVDSKVDITVKDKRLMTRGGGEIQDRTELDVISFIVRVGPGQRIYGTSTQDMALLGVGETFIHTNPKFYTKERGNVAGINQLVNRIKGQKKVESRLMNEGPRVVEQEQGNLKLEQRKDSFTVHASKKILLLSTQVTPNLISTKPDQYGLTQKELADLVDQKQKRTYATVRGELMIQTLLRLVDLFLAHGHSTGNTVKNSLEEGTREELTKLKEELSKKVNQDLSGGPSLLNQYIRVN